MKIEKFICFLENNKIERKYFRCDEYNYIYLYYRMFYQNEKKTYDYYFLELFNYFYTFKNFKKILINKEQFNINLQKFNLINNIEIIEEKQQKRKNKI